MRGSYLLFHDLSNYSRFCDTFREKATAESYRETKIKDGYVPDKYSFNMSSKKGDGTVKIEKLPISGHRKRSNSIFEGFVDLRYRFIVCDGAIHIAYAIKPKTIRYRDERPLKGSLAVNSVLLRIAISDRSKPVDEVSDKFASDSLGMGCFDGQTKKLSYTGGAKGSQELAAVAERLEIVPSVSDIGLITPLQEYGEDTDADNAKAQAQAAMDAEAKAKEQSELRAANDKAQADTIAQTKRIVADQAAARAAKAKYELDQQKYRDEIARYEQEKREHEEALEKSRQEHEAYRLRYAPK